MNLDGTPDAEDLEFYDRYGPWDSLDPDELKSVMEGYPKPWWVVGGHAIEAFTGVPRPHEDVDLVVFGRDTPDLRAHFENALAPWIIDCPLNPDVDGQWQSKRDESHVADLEDVTWVDDRGIRFLNPEIVLLFKAAQNRAKDEHDLEQAWPLLSDEKQGWLREALHKYDSEHPWNERLARG